jgi:hypothetical protein
MNGWFDDPFFDSGPSQMPDMFRHFDEMHRRISGMMGSMFSGFGEYGLGFDDPPIPALEDGYSRRARSSASRDRSRRSHPVVEEVDDDFVPRSHGRPIVEEPDDRGRSYEEPPAYFYSSSMTSYSGADGVTHAQRRTYDSTTGRTQLAEMRRLGDQAVAMKREIEADGTYRDAMDRRNLDDGELEDFGRRWEARSAPRIGHSVERRRERSRSQRRALE